MAWNFLDLYHRAFRAFRGEVACGKQENKLAREICRTPSSVEHLRAIHFSCEIKTDWIEAIERGLPFVEKAILENRQFILQQGETQLIEKAKRVSRASVEHLSKHSELITREPAPGADLVPDKIYVVENDSNFAVYENRFLYMLLCDLSEFIDLRCAKILEYWDKYTAELTLKKKVEIGKQKLDFVLSFTEESRGDKSEMDAEAKAAMDRVAELGRTVSFLLQTGLMKEMAHAPRLKPPVARTNVLKMDQNFKAAVELYDFLCAYEGDGFRMTEHHEDTDRFADTMQEEFAELVTTSSYLTWRYGSGQSEELDRRFELENERRRDEEDREYRKLLAETKAKWQSGEVTAEEYVQALEKRNEALENDRNELRITQNELHLCNESLRGMTKLRDSLAEKIERLEANIVALKQEMADQASAFRSELRAQKEKYEAELAALREEYEALTERMLATEAQVHALRHEHGLPDGDYSSREMLGELERERKAFDKMFNAQWKKAKKNIRKQAFSKAKNDNDQNDSKEDSEA